jgi:hypothetical protein
MHLNEFYDSDCVTIMGIGRKTMPGVGPTYTTSIGWPWWRLSPCHSTSEQASQDPVRVPGGKRKEKRWFFFTFVGWTIRTPASWKKGKTFWCSGHSPVVPLPVTSTRYDNGVGHVENWKALGIDVRICACSAVNTEDKERREGSVLHLRLYV